MLAACATHVWGNQQGHTRTILASIHNPNMTCHSHYACSPPPHTHTHNPNCNPRVFNTHLPTCVWWSTQCALVRMRRPVIMKPLLLLLYCRLRCQGRLKLGSVWMQNT